MPILTGVTGEDPLIRQRLVAHPEWLRDVKFVSSRITAEVGPKPFEAFRAHSRRRWASRRSASSRTAGP